MLHAPAPSHFDHTRMQRNSSRRVHHHERGSKSATRSSRNSLKRSGIFAPPLSLPLLIGFMQLRRHAGRQDFDVSERPRGLGSIQESGALIESRECTVVNDFLHLVEERKLLRRRARSAFSSPPLLLSSDPLPPLLLSSHPFSPRYLISFLLSCSPALLLPCSPAPLSSLAPRSLIPTHEGDKAPQQAG